MSFYLELKQAILRQYFRRSYSFQRLPVGQRLVLIVLPMISLFGLLVMLFSSPTAPPISTEISDRPVHVDFFVMSKCPDARLCETLFIPSLLKLSPIVNFTLSFIAYRNRKNEISCMHGPDECLGNEQQLCVQHLYSQKIFLQFLQCQARRIDAIPSNGEECAKELGAQGVEWSKIDACVKSSGAKELFAQALERTRLAQAKKSCTIHLNGKFWCMHDGDWYACSDGHDEKSFLQAICSRYNGTNKPHECDHLN